MTDVAEEVFANNSVIFDERLQQRSHSEPPREFSQLLITCFTGEVCMDTFFAALSMTHSAEEVFSNTLVTTLTTEFVE